MPMTKKQLSNQIEQLKERKSVLLKLKESSQLSEKDQQELDEVTEKLFDLEEALENFGKKPNANDNAMDAGEETADGGSGAEDASSEAADKGNSDASAKTQKQHNDVLVLKIQNGKRFDADSGKEINPPFEQTFTRSEWNNFKRFHKNCGYKIVEVVHDPWGEADAFVSKEAESKQK